MTKFKPIDANPRILHSTETHQRETEKWSSFGGESFKMPEDLEIR